MRRNGGFRVRRVTAKDHGYRYVSYQVVGYLHGERVRKKFKVKEEAEGEMARLEIEAANSGQEIRAVPTHLSVGQVRGAEAAYALTPDLIAAVQWYKANYRPPLVEIAVEDAVSAFLADREPHVSEPAMRDYMRTLRYLVEAFPKRIVATFETAELEAHLKSRGIGPKRFNNQRGDLNAFFNYCANSARKWIEANPVKAIAKFKIARGLPEILTPEKCADLMAFLETYAGPERSHHGVKRKPGCLVPYFALCLFAGIRPDVRKGEIRKLGDRPDAAKLIDLGMGVLRITPEISKVDGVRQIKIRDNLAAWLKRYPLEQYPIVMQNMQDMVSIVRAKFGLSEDVLRHTFISCHVAKWKSLGEAALEAGNSEAMIKRHYLNMLSDAQAEAFWSIVPSGTDSAIRPNLSKLVQPS